MENKQDMEKEQQNAPEAESNETQTNAAEATAETNEASEESKAEEAQPESEVDTLKRQLAEMTDRYMRTAAEYDNYRRRTAKEKADLIKSAGSDILAGLLPVVDDMERALSHMSAEADAKAIKDGVDLIYKKFTDFLTKRGVTPIETKDMELDTNVHEAITMMPAPTPEQKGKIFDCVEKGYMLGDKVLRFAKVVVCQ